MSATTTASSDLLSSFGGIGGVIGIAVSGLLVITMCIGLAVSFCACKKKGAPVTPMNGSYPPPGYGASPYGPYGNQPYYPQNYPPYNPQTYPPNNGQPGFSIAASQPSRYSKT